ncbi:SNF2 family N-terminal domain-containing protein [Truncatella angustata]|uniref:SNF2 family N-terminal domain-containing protein n=1 Tax=Truncatella angustata TaxID=152316 RepID=A0A9P8UK05_9PEZI|nr:SNF2 family N-terminal domain-containing protein [Truncatella angustata]KAH6653504.1 SNF2 family N-terminal domain-containing protein [Truncatella angustata]
MTDALYAHQAIALKWMQGVEEDKSRKGGILADAMGLGKTITALALILTRLHWRSSTSPTLVVAPVALVNQWEREAVSKIKPEYGLRILNTQKTKCTLERLRSSDLVLTTYGKLRSEVKAYDEAADRESDDKGSLLGDDYLTRKFPIFGPDSMFHRVILDEAHLIRNADTATAKAVSRVRAEHRWCLTGTPMMNSVDDLAGLMQFLQVESYSDPKVFREAFKTLQRRQGETSSDHVALEKLQALLNGMMLRRTKDSLVDGSPIISLPIKEEVTEHVVLSDHEEVMYNNIHLEAQQHVSNLLHGTSKHRSTSLSLLLRLRQACCHPELYAISRKSSRVKNYPVEIVGDVEQRNSTDTPRGDLVDHHNDVRHEYDDGLVGSNHNVGESNMGESSDKRFQETNEAIPEKSTVANTIVESGCETCVKRTVDSRYEMQRSSDSSPGEHRLREPVIAKGNARPQPQPMAYLQQSCTSSAKIAKCMNIMRDIQATGEKTIIFSQWTLLLDLLELQISKAMIKFCRYDGSMRSVHRDKAVDDFTAADSKVKVILMSLHAGNAGLNLAAASHIILMDPFWNPFVEDQAIGRAHRMGQTKKVKVHRLLVKGTIEDRIVELQAHKRKQVDGVLNQDAVHVGALNTNDLGFLLDVSSR